MYCLIPIKEVYKVKTTTRGADGKEQVKYQNKEVNSYSHSSWLEDHNEEKIVRIQQSQCYWTRFAGVTTSIVSFLAYQHVPFINKLGWKAGLGGTAAAGVLAYAIAGYALGKSSNAAIHKIISEHDLIPTWRNKERVVEKQNVYFFLDDDKGFAPNVLYHGISEKQIDSSFPDGRFGNSKLAKLYHSKVASLLSNKDANQTNHLIESLDFTPRAKGNAPAHH